MSERRLGPIVLLQVQRTPLKVPGGPYDPRPLLPVSEAAVGPEGMAGFHDGAWVLDAHHAAHPARRGGAGRALSIGFTGHYRLMAERFGSVPVGIGGENLIVEAPGRLYVKDLLGTVLVRTCRRGPGPRRAPRWPPLACPSPRSCWASIGWRSGPRWPNPSSSSATACGASCSGPRPGRPR